jgi:hypothetical protein
MGISKPLHEATLCDQRLRFFISAIEDGRPDFPGHAVDDLQRCVGMPASKGEFFIRKQRKFGVPMQTIATSDGHVTVAPHFVALALIEAYAAGT